MHSSFIAIFVSIKQVTWYLTDTMGHCLMLPPVGLHLLSCRTATDAHSLYT